MCPLTVGWVSPSVFAAGVIPPSWTTRAKISRCLRSRPWTTIVVVLSFHALERPACVLGEEGIGIVGERRDHVAQFGISRIPGRDQEVAQEAAAAGALDRRGAEALPEAVARPLEQIAQRRAGERGVGREERRVGEEVRPAERTGGEAGVAAEGAEREGVAELRGDRAALLDRDV